MRTTGFLRWSGRAALAILAFGLGLGSRRVEAAPLPLADSYLSFTLNAQPGQGRITFDGGPNPLVGTDLGVLVFKGISTTQNSDEMTKIVGGALNFTTGPFQGGTPDGRHWEFGPGGSLTITGGIPLLGLPPGTPLLAGTFDGPVEVVGVGDRGLKVQSGAFFNTINPVLAAHLGLPADGTPYFGALATLFAAEGASPGGFASSGYTSGDVTTAPVPEPASVLVFAVGIIGGLAWRRRVGRSWT